MPGFGVRVSTVDASSAPAPGYTGSDCAPDDWLCKALAVVDFGAGVFDRFDYSAQEQEQNKLEALKAQAAIERAKADAIAAQSITVTPVIPAWAWALSGVLVVLVLFTTYRVVRG